MKTKRRPFRKLFSLIALILIGYTFFIEPTLLYAASMSDYCVVPPYVKKDVQPNILVLFDNSSNMKKAAYDADNNGVLDTYVSTKTYEGYFKSDIYYSYGSNVFTPDASGIYKGNLLNWATTSRFDLLQKILVDGKSTAEVGIPKYLWNETESWYGEYDGCKFSVDSNNLIVSDITANSCVLVNGSRLLSASLEGIPVAQGSEVRDISFAKQVKGFDEGENAMAQNSEVGNKSAMNILKSITYKLTAFLAGVMDFLVPDAEAVAPLKICDTGHCLLLGNGAVCVYYEIILTGSGGNGSYIWSASGLPPGLNICSGTANCVVGSTTYTPGTVYGTPTTAGNYSITVTLNDTVSHTPDSKTYSITIAAAAALSISTATLPDATQGAAYSATLSSNGGCGTKTWSITLDPSNLFTTGGLTINSSTGQITSASVNMSPGTYSFTARVDDSTGFATRSISLPVVAPIAGIDSTTAMTLKVCRGDYTNNCSAGTGPLSKQGILQLFADKSRIGLEDFNKTDGSPEVPSGTCIAPSQSSNFFTQVENVQPYTGNTALVNGEYTAIYEYMTDFSANCDPFRDATACMKNTVLIITDGKGADTGTNVWSDATNCTSTQGVNYNLSKNSCYGHNNDLRANCISTDNPAGCQNGKQVISTYLVNTMGNYTCGGVSCGTILAEAATKGDGNYYNVTDPATLRDYLIQAFQDIIKRAAAGTAASVLASGEGSGANLIQAVFYPRRKFFNSQTGAEDEINWIGRLTNLWYYVDPFFSLSNIREDDGDKILNLQATVAGTHHDYITSLYFDTTTEMTKAKRWEDPLGNGVSGTQITPDVEFEKLGSLWEAGLDLWKRDITVAANKRKIYTTINGTSLLSGNFSADTNNGDSNNTATLMPYLDLPTTDIDLDGYYDGDFNHDTNVDATDASILINYIHGTDYSTLRTRSVKVDLSSPPDGDTLDNVGGYDETVARVWKLGDVLNSTPKISSWLPLSSYQKAYNDNTYGEAGKDPSLSDDADTTHYITSNSYRSRAMVFAGANDGMLHAFKLGTLGLKWTSQGTFEKATLGKHCSTSGKPCVVNGDCASNNCISDTDLGKEVWAFIPKNILPYLKYIADPGYCHVYSVDLTPYVFDASINIDTADVGQSAACTNASYSNYWECKKTVNSWRTILIGGMRFGGACRSTSCAGLDCVTIPDSTNSNGYSSYFALDVTDQNNPQLLWEFTDTTLGFTTTGPSIVRINARKLNADNTASVIDDIPAKNGRWLVVFGSGPTGPIDTTTQQFLGHSDQNLRLFILDLKTGSLLRTIDTTIPDAFAGSMLNVSHDADTDYQDDVVYIPYVRACTVTDTGPCTYNLLGTTTWTNGGVIRLVTKEDLSGTNLAGNGDTALNPGNWAASTLMDGIGPVTSSVVKLQNLRTNTLWTYFGTGRYYFEQGATTDDSTNQRRLFGVTEPCFLASKAIDPTCTTSRSLSSLSQVDLATTAGVTDAEGWYINLDASTSTLRAERVITDPLASITGLVFFTTYTPYSDECSLGGKSFIWAVKYDTGGAAGALLKGKALVQVSTGSIEQLDLSTAFSEKGGRRSSAMEGVPPTAQGLSLISSPPPVKRVLHIRER